MRCVRNGLRLFSLFLLSGWMICIFYLSAQTSRDSAEASHRVALSVATLAVTGNSLHWDSPEIMPEQRRQIVDMAGGIHNAVRKAAHVVEYCVLAIVLLFFCVIWYKRAHYKLVMLCCVIFSVSDELHQLFISGRGARFSDILLDSLSALLGICIFFVAGRLFRRHIVYTAIFVCCLLLPGGGFTRQTQAAPSMPDSVAIPGVRTPPGMSVADGGGFQASVRGVLSSPSGMRIDFLSVLREHKGIDIAAEEGSPVTASTPGKVLSAGDFHLIGGH